MLIYYDPLYSYRKSKGTLKERSVEELLFRNCSMFGADLLCKKKYGNAMNSSYTAEQLEALSNELMTIIDDAGLLDEYAKWFEKKMNEMEEYFASGNENFFAEEEKGC